MIIGRDVSELNRGLTRDWFAQYDFVIIRAFNEHGRPDVLFDQYYRLAAGVTKRGVYGWPIAGADNHELGWQLGLAALDAEIGAWADYERPPHGQLATPTELQQYVEGFDSAGVRGGFYSNLSERPESPFLDGTPWWFANPSGNDAPRGWAMQQGPIISGIDSDWTTADKFLEMQGIPVPIPVEVDEMLVIVFGQQAAGIHVGYLTQAGRAVATFPGTPADPYGIPPGAADYLKRYPSTPLQLAYPADLLRVTTA